MTKEEIKPCPFCGNAYIRIETISEMGSAWVVCPTCGASTEPSNDGRNMSERVAVAKWNRRELQKKGKLKPCPCCGNTKPTMMCVLGEAWVKCTDCGMSGGMHGGAAGEAERNAAESWNARAKVEKFNEENNKE